MRETVRVTRGRWDVFFAAVTLLFAGVAWVVRKEVGLPRATGYVIAPLVLWTLLHWNCPPAGLDAPRWLSGPPAERRFLKLWMLLFTLFVGGMAAALRFKIPWYWVAPAVLLLLGILFYFAHQVDRERAATARTAGPRPSR